MSEPRTPNKKKARKERADERAREAALGGSPPSPRRSTMKRIVAPLLVLAAIGIAAALVFRGSKTEMAAPVAEEGPSVRKNLLLITLDTTRADHLGCYGYAAAQTPAFDGLAARGVLFENAYATAPLTLPSHATILTGMYPLAHGVRNNARYRLSDEAPTLAESFSGAGWRTGAFVSAFVVDKSYGLGQGFEIYDDDLLGGALAENVADVKMRPAGQTWDRALPWLESARGEKFFLWLHFFDAHTPYRPHPEFEAKFPNLPYDAQIAYVDGVMGKILERLKAWGILNQTLVVVAADHGEGLGEHRETAHGFFIYDSTMRVPWVFFQPGQIAEGKRLAQTVSLADLAPTVLDYFSIPALPKQQGRSLLPALEGKGELAEQPVYLETRAPMESERCAMLSGVVLNKMKFILAPRSEFYDLLRDPAELKNLYASGDARSGEIKKVFDERRASLLPAGGEEVFSGRAMTKEEEAKMKSLGYAFAGGDADEKSARRDPKDAILPYERFDAATQMASRGDLQGAEAALQDVLRDDPGHAGAYSLLGYVYESLGRLDEAERMYRKSLRFDSGKGEPRVGLANIAVQRGKPEEAKPLFEEALSLDPYNLDGYHGLFTLLVQIKDMEAASRVAQDGLKYFPYSEVMHYDLGVALREMGRYGSAREHFETAVRLNPDFHVARESLADLLRKTGG